MSFENKRAGIFAVALCASALCAVGSSAADMDHPMRGRGDPGKDCAGRARSWSVQPGDDLEEVIRGWARTAGWDVVWNSDYSYSIAGRARFTGTFAQALGGLMAGMQEARPSPVADIHRNCVVVVSDGLTETR